MLPFDESLFDVKDIGLQTLKLPGRVPVMVLPDATLFPNALLPLHIFEPRYRKMLAWALERNRMFSVALLKPGLWVEEPPARACYQTAGVGLVRACVQRGDGTSDLVLQGLARVRFTGFVEETPFPIAEVRELQSQPVPQLQGEALSAKLLELCRELQAQSNLIPDKIQEQLAKLTDPEMLCDVIAQTLLRDAHRRQELLEELEVGARLRALIRHLRAQLR